ncbi:MAG: tetratricopeptide repeat protein [Treponema sp.]
MLLYDKLPAYRSGFILSLLLFLVPSVYAQPEDALVRYREGNYKRAAEICRQEIARTPRNIDSYVVLAWALLADGQYKEAAGWIVQGRAVSQYDPRLIESHAQALYHLGKNEESLRLFEDYIAYAPNGARLGEVYYHIGEIYLRMAKYRHADIALSAAVQLEQLNSMWWTRLAYSREQAREYRHALEAYSTALQLNKNSTDAQKGYERVLRRF